MSFLVTGTQNCFTDPFVAFNANCYSNSQSRAIWCRNFISLCHVQRKFTFHLATSVASFGTCAFLNVLHCPLIEGDTRLSLIFPTLCWIMAESEPPKSNSSVFNQVMAWLFLGGFRSFALKSIPWSCPAHGWFFTSTTYSVLFAHITKLCFKFDFSNLVKFLLLWAFYFLEAKLFSPYA